MSNYYLKAKKKKTDKQTHKNIQADITLLVNNLCLQEQSARISFNLLLSPLKNKKNQDNCNRFIRLKAISSSSDNSRLV